jgi:hypothetical protein
MGRELGRISGPLLADNLKRNGIDLAFETNLLYFDVTNNRIGINFNSPTTDLFVNSTTNAPIVRIDTEADFANFVVNTNTISATTGSITISPDQSSDPTIVVPTLSTANLNFNTNYIQSTLASDSINFTATGTIKLNSNTLISGTLGVTGNITFDGNITLGDSNTDTVTFGAEVNSDILPSEYDLSDELNNIFQTEDGNTLSGEGYSLGSNTNNCLRLYSNTVLATLIQPTNISSNNITAGSLLIQNNTIYNKTPDSSVVFSPNGSGVVNLNNFLTFKDNTVNNTSGTVFTFSQSSNLPIKGLYKFTTGDVGAVVIPLGDATNYTPEIGTIRFNPTLSTGQVYTTDNGWISWQGPPQGIANQTTYSEEVLIYTLMLGL